MADVQDYLADSRPWTKARVFAVAGLLSYDIGQVHPASRLVCKALKTALEYILTNEQSTKYIDKFVDDLYTPASTMTEIHESVREAPRWT